jgi:hypothetical protein
MPKFGSLAIKNVKVRWKMAKFDFVCSYKATAHRGQGSILETLGEVAFLSAFGCVTAKVAIFRRSCPAFKGLDFRVHWIAWDRKVFGSNPARSRFCEYGQYHESFGVKLNKLFFSENA